MNITLDPQLEKFVREKIAAGEYASPAEVVEAGIARLMLDAAPEHFDQQALAAIRESKAQIARGEVVDFKQFAAEIRKRYIKS